MLNKDVYIVCPKLEAYRFKDLTQRSFYELKTKEWYDYYHNLGCNIVCFAEDMLAVELLHDEEVTWLTTLGAADRNFMEKMVYDIPSEYFSINKQPVHSSRIKHSMLKYKTKTLAECNYDEDYYNRNTLNTILNRIRYVANTILEEDCKALVYFKSSTSNQYCNMPEDLVGNGMSVIVVEQSRNLETYTFGGVEMNKENFLQVEECIYAKNI